VAEVLAFIYYLEKQASGQGNFELNAWLPAPKSAPQFP